MIYVSDEHLEEVEYLLSQARQGNHILFDPKTIRKAYERSTTRPISQEEAYAMEPHLERLLELPDDQKKKAYLSRLSEEEIIQLVQTYFCVIENDLLERIQRKGKMLA